MVYYQKQLFDGNLPSISDRNKFGEKCATPELAKATELYWDSRYTRPDNMQVAIVRVDNDSPGNHPGIIMEILPAGLHPSVKV